MKRADPGPVTHLERLAAELFEGVADDVLAAEVAGWLETSRRFRAFATTHRAKIHKKLRGTTDAAGLADVRAELRVAQLLLADPRVELAYEAHGSGRPGPDFTVSVRGERTFDLEVTRLRAVPAHGGPLLAKLRQFPPSVPNLLVIALAGDRADALDVAAIVRDLRARADRKDDAFFAARGFDDARGFYDRLLRLGGVVVWCEAAVGEGRLSRWTNGSARIALPERAVRIVLAALASVDANDLTAPRAPSG